MHEILISDVLISLIFIFSDASAENMVAATPEWLFMPSPITDTFAMSLAISISSAPTSSATFLEICFALSKSSFVTVKVRSVSPPERVFWMIISTVISSSARGENILAEIPG